MGVTTLAQFREELTDSLARGAVSTTLLDRWLNRAQAEFGHAFKFRELEAIDEQTLVADTNTILPPSDFRFLHELGIWIADRDDNSGRLIPETRENYLRHYNSADESGEPKYFHVYGNLIYLRPKFDDVETLVQVHYWKSVPKLTLVTDTTVFDDDWDDITLTGALYRGHRHFAEHDRYFNVRNDFLAMIRSRVNQDDLEPFPEGGLNLIGKGDTEESYQYGQR